MDNPDEYKFRILNKDGKKIDQKETMLNYMKI